MLLSIAPPDAHADVPCNVHYNFLPLPPHPMRTRTCRREDVEILVDAPPPDAHADVPPNPPGYALLGPQVPGWLQEVVTRAAVVVPLRHPPPRFRKLAGHEAEIREWLAAGRSYREISAELHVAQSAVWYFVQTQREVAGA